MIDVLTRQSAAQKKCRPRLTVSKNVNWNLNRDSLRLFLRLRTSRFPEFDAVFNQSLSKQRLAVCSPLMRLIHRRQPISRRPRRSALSTESLAAPSVAPPSLSQSCRRPAAPPLCHRAAIDMLILLSTTNSRLCLWKRQRAPALIFAALCVLRALAYAAARLFKLIFVLECQLSFFFIENTSTICFCCLQMVTISA